MRLSGRRSLSGSTRSTVFTNNTFPKITFESLCVVAKIAQMQLVIPPPSKISNLPNLFQEGIVFCMAEMAMRINFASSSSPPPKGAQFQGRPVRFSETPCKKPSRCKGRRVRSRSQVLDFFRRPWLERECCEKAGRPCRDVASLGAALFTPRRERRQSGRGAAASHDGRRVAIEHVPSLRFVLSEKRCLQKINQRYELGRANYSRRSRREVVQH